MSGPVSASSPMLQTRAARRGAAAATATEAEAVRCPGGAARKPWSPICTEGAREIPVASARPSGPKEETLEEQSGLVERSQQTFPSGEQCAVRARGQEVSQASRGEPGGPGGGVPCAWRVWCW